MKKTITLLAMFILLFKMNGQNLDNLYANATLNSDFSSAILLSEKETVLEDQLAEWILSNKSNFENINEIKIAFENKWFWGSWKKVVKALEFVKTENIQKRIKYFEVLRKLNEAECRRQQERSQILTGLAVGGITLLGITIWKNRYEIGNFIAQNWKNNSPSNYSNDSKYSFSNNSNSSNNEVKKVTNEFDCETQILQEYDNINKSNIKYEAWALTDDLVDIDYKQFIEFPDGTRGKIYKTKPEGKYYLSLGIGSSVFYDSNESVIKALYIYKKCDGKITKLGKN